MRFAALTLFLAMSGAPALAQPLAPSCYSPDRQGWVGPSVELGCLPCCGCRSTAFSMQWQVRDEDAGWTTQPISSVPGRYVSGQFGTRTHLARYCMRTRFADDAGPGTWGPTNGTACNDAGVDLCFTWDLARPSTPTLLDGGVVPGTNRVEVHFAPSTDDGGGVARYAIRHLPSGSAPVGTFGSSSGSPVSEIFGAGTYSLAVWAEDRALNPSSNSAPLTVTFGFDASVATPPAPVWPVTVTNEDYTEVSWPDDGADSWVVTQRLPDGGFGVTVRARVSSLGALLQSFGPCRLHAARIARVVGDQVSDWSPPSADLLADMVDPVAFAPELVGVDGGVAILRWQAAQDGCPSGITYRIERSLDGSPFALRGTTATTDFADPLDAVGEHRWRVVAIDGAGNLARSDAGATLLIDGGTDAGEPDAGAARPDAGEPDAGAADAGTDDAGGASDAGVPDAGVEQPAPQSLTVGCGCSSFEGVAALLALAWFRRRSHRGERETPLRS